MFSKFTDDSVITCGEITEETKPIPTKTVPPKTVPTKSALTNFNEIEIICKTKNFYILLTFL